MISEGEGGTGLSKLGKNSDICLKLGEIPSFQYWEWGLTHPTPLPYKTLNNPCEVTSLSLTFNILNFLHFPNMLWSLYSDFWLLYLHCMSEPFKKYQREHVLKQISIYIETSSSRVKDVWSAPPSSVHVWALWIIRIM